MSNFSDAKAIVFQENQVNTTAADAPAPCHQQPQSYRKTSSISRTKSQNLNVACILLQLSSLNPLKPGV